MSTTSHDSETPAQGQQVFTVCAFIHRKVDGVDKVFLAQRALSKKFLPGNYEMPGGHIDYGEDMVVGLKREIREELGVEVTIGDPFAVFTYVNDIKSSHSIEVVYFATLATSADDITLDPNDHLGAAWLSEAEAKHINNSPEEALVIRKGFALLRGESPEF